MFVVVCCLLLCLNERKFTSVAPCEKNGGVAIQFMTFTSVALMVTHGGFGLCGSRSSSMGGLVIN